MQRPPSRHRPCRGLPRGLTLVELLTVAAVLVILIATAVPAMNGFAAANQIAGTRSAFGASLALARSEAAKRGVAVIVHARGAPAAGNEYAAGWEIVLDDNGNGVADANDTVLRRFDALPSGIALSGNSNVVYLPTGYLATPVERTFTVCRTGGSHAGFRIAVAPSGVTDTAPITTCP